MKNGLLSTSSPSKTGRRSKGASLSINRHSWLIFGQDIEYPTFYSTLVAHSNLSNVNLS